MSGKRSFSVASDSFYGNQTIESPLQKRIREQVEFRQKHKVARSHPFYACLTGGNDVWRVFSRQREAYDYLNSECEPNLRLFSFESPSGPPGKRSYVCCTAERFWHEYCTIENRHCYELIMEDKPCRLYFDVEFYRHCNPGLDGEKCLALMVHFVLLQLSEQFQVEATKDCVLDLDASTEGKFSRHLIFHLPGDKVFASNADAGQFVTDLRHRCSQHEETERQEEGSARLWVVNRSGVRTPIWDVSVYSRNRNFRLYLSTKLGHHNPLRLAENCGFYDKPPSEMRIFADSLITVLDAKESWLISVEVKKSDKQKAKCRTGLAEGKQEGGITQGGGPSPCPVVDEFILGMLRKRKESVYLRSWKAFENTVEECKLPTTLVYEVGNDRFCYNIDREHRSNNVLWVVDFERKVYYQKCYDPDCRAVDFKSNEFPLDPSLVQYANAENAKRMGQGRTTNFEERAEQLNESDLALCQRMSELEREGVI